MELSEIREVLRERSLVESPPLDYGFKIVTHDLFDPRVVLVLDYDLPLAMQPWQNLDDGDVIYFFFEDSSINLARVVNDELKLGLCLHNQLPFYERLKGSLMRYSRINIIVMHRYGGVELVLEQGINGRYRVTTRSDFPEFKNDLIREKICT